MDIQQLISAMAWVKYHGWEFTHRRWILSPPKVCHPLTAIVLKEHDFRIPPEVDPADWVQEQLLERFGADFVDGFMDAWPKEAPLLRDVGRTPDWERGYELGADLTHQLARASK